MLKDIIKNFITHFIFLAKRIRYQKGTVVSRNVTIIKAKKAQIYFNGCKIRNNVFISVDPNSALYVGKNTDIGERSRITVNYNVVIGNNVLFGPNVFISDMSHEYRDVDTPIIAQGTFTKDKVTIEDDAWIGTNVCILPGSHIGKHCVIGCNSVVNSEIPDYSVAVGNPARVVRKFNFNNKKWEKVI